MVALVIYRNPTTTPISVSFDAVKIDADGNQRKTVPIELTGKWIYPLFQDARLELTASEFDRMARLELLGNDDSTFPGAVPMPNHDVPYLMCVGWVFNTLKNEPAHCIVLFSPDYERWMIAFELDDTFYVGSVNEEDTVEDLYEYFKPAITRN